MVPEAVEQIEKCGIYVLLCQKYPSDRGVAVHTVARDELQIIEASTAAPGLISEPPGTPS
jgi:hypothetical protein